MNGSYQDDIISRHRNARSPASEARLLTSAIKEAFECGVILLSNQLHITQYNKHHRVLVRVEKSEADGSFVYCASLYVQAFTPAGDGQELIQFTSREQLITWLSLRPSDLT